MINTSVDHTSAAQLLDRAADRLENTAGLFGFAGNQLAEYEREVFATRGFGEWAPSDADTILAKGNSRVLVDSGLLLRELTTPKVEGESVVVNAGRADYAKKLREGKTRARRDPAPPPTPARVEQWADELIGFLLDEKR